MSLADLIRVGLLSPGESLHHPSGAVASVDGEGNLVVDGASYVSPTQAHLALSPTSRNGWLVWSLGGGRGGTKLADLRKRYRERPASAGQ